MPGFSRFPADYDYDYDYDYDASGSSNVSPVGSDLLEDGERWPLLSASQFPRRYWDPQLYALLTVIEFADTGWKSGSNSIDLGPIPAPAKIEEELTQLAGYDFSHRNGLLPEILKQRSNMAAYWLNLLMFSRKSHPATFELVNIALRVGQFAAMHFKKKYNRPRPSQLSPSIFPIIAVPDIQPIPAGMPPKDTCSPCVLPSWFQRHRFPSRNWPLVLHTTARSQVCTIQATRWRGNACRPAVLTA